MATTIGNLAVILSANAAGFSAGMAAAQKSVTSFLGTMGSMAKSAGAFVGVASAVGLVGKAFKGFTDAEESLLTFQSLLGSASAAKKFKEELKDWGDTTPFGDGVKAAAKELLKFNFAQDAVLPTLKSMGDVAAGLNIPLEEMAAVVGKSGYRASISNKQLSALSEMGVPIMQELTKNTGMSQAAIVQMAEQGAIKFEHLMAAFDSASSRGGNFFNMTEKRANTIKNLQARIVDQIGDVIGKLGSVLGNRISAMFGLKSAGGAFFDWLQRVEEGVKNMGPWFDNIILVFQTAGDVANTVWTGVSNTFTWAWGVLKSALDKTGINVQTFRDFFTDAMRSVQFVFQNFGDLVSSIAGRVILKLWGFGADVAFIFTDTIPAALTWFSDNWRGIWDNIAKFLEYKLAQMHDFFAKYADDFKLGIATLLEATGAEDFKGAARRVFDQNVAAEKARGVLVPPVFQQIPAPVFGKRALSEEEKGFQDNLDKIDEKLANAKRKFMGEVLPGFVPSQQDNPGGKRDQNLFGNLSAKTETKFAGAFEAGSKEAYNVVLRSRDAGKKPQEQTADNTKQTAKHTKDAAMALQKIAGLGVILAAGSLDVGGG